MLLSGNGVYLHLYYVLVKIKLGVNYVGTLFNLI